MRKFAVFLLFQFQTIKNDTINKKRICEERIYHIESETSELAYTKAKEIGIKEEFSYIENNIQVHFQFIGIIELIELSIYDDKNLVWSNFIEKVNPMERKNRIIPLKNKLAIFRTSKGKLKLQ
jgi:hypothetical protein